MKGGGGNEKPEDIALPCANRNSTRILYSVSREHEIKNGGQYLCISYARKLFMEM